MNEMEAHIETLIAKAAAAPDSCDAMRFAQAALNAAQAVNTMDIMVANHKPTD